MLGHDTIHPSNPVLLERAVSDDLHEGSVERMSAAEWLRRRAHHDRAETAIRRARDGEKGACFRAVDGVVRHLRRVEAARAG